MLCFAGTLRSLQSHSVALASGGPSDASAGLLRCYFERVAERQFQGTSTADYSDSMAQALYKTSEAAPHTSASNWRP